HTFAASLEFSFGDLQILSTTKKASDTLVLSCACEAHVIEVILGIRSTRRQKAKQRTEVIDNRATLCTTLEVSAEHGAGFEFWLQFSDRINYQLPYEIDKSTKGVGDLWRLSAEDTVSWRTFLNQSCVHTGNNEVNAFRRVSLCSLRSQSSPWSIPPTVSEEYWG